MLVLRAGELSTTTGPDAIRRTPSFERSQRMESEVEQFRLFIEHTPAAVAMFDTDMRYLAASRRWMTDYRLEDTSIVGRSHYEIFPGIPERWREIHRRALAGSIERCDEDIFERADGTTDWIRWSVVPWRDDQGEVGGLMVLTEVITERKRLEMRVQQSEKLASLGRLVGGVAHDFNNLLSVILGNAELAAMEGATAPEVQESLSQIQHAAAMGAKLTGQLLALGRSHPLQPTPRRFDEALEREAPMFERLVPANIRVQWKLGAGDAHVNFDDNLVSMALINLVLNARDAMPEGGTLTVTTARVKLGRKDLSEGELLHAGVHVRCDLSDTGHGMDSMLLNRVRDPFFTTKARGLGTGLGLASVVGVVEQHGGAVRLTSTPGRGTTATILLPTCSRRSAPRAARKPAADDDRPPTACILVVEDVAEVRDFIERVLRHEGHAVESAASAEEALARWPTIGDDVDLVLSDILMPGMNGHALRLALLASRPDLQVLFMSGYDDRPAQERDATSADVPLLRKPFGAAELVSKVAWCLAHESAV
jgi:PAS domain S-box-containing protein